jgi:hypothetical protein
MANDPRSFTVKSCPIQNQASANQSARKKSFLDNILKVGDLELLNDVGFGKVGEGLRVLASVSDAIRTGKGVVPGREGTDTYNSTLGKIVGTAADAVSDGTNAVLDAVGLGGVAESVGNLNPEVANRAYGQAQAIFERVKQGNFELSDIPGVFQDLQNLETLSRNIFGQGGTTAPVRELCGATPYARDLIAYAPKFKFLFIVEVKFAPAYANWAQIGSEMAFVVKTSTRPRFDVEYEDINMYNFRTRVAKRVEYPAMTMSFYDDNKNAAHSFYTAYLRAMSPIANIKTDHPQSGDYEQSGMNFNRPASAATFSSTAPSTSGHSASLGALVGSTTSIVREITLHHVFDYGNKMNSYHFYNPRITSFSPSDLSQLETGDGTEFEFEFMYDGLYIDHNYNLEADTNRLKNLTDNFGMRPINPVYAASDGGPSLADTANGIPPAQSQEDNAPTSNFVGDVSAAVGGITDAFGNVIGGVTDAATGLINGVTGQIGSTIPTDARPFGSDISSARNVIYGAVDGATGGASNGNFTSGLTGAMNQNMSAAQRALGGTGTTASNALLDSSFNQSSFVS